jgi:tetratricopeptide (TPR) repeat protein
LSIGAVVLARRVPAVIVGWLMYLGMLVPVIGLVQIGGQARADRYMYLPLIGVAIAVAWGALAFAKSMTARRALGALAALVVVGYAVVANAQVQHWRDTVTLWSHTARATDKVNNFGVYFGLAEYLRATGRASESIPVYEKSIAKNATYFEARMGLARSLVETRQEPRAIDELKAAVALQPDSVETRMSLALLLGEANRMPEAVAQFGEAVRLKPDDPGIRHDFARALAQNKQFAEAAREWEEVVRRDPKMIDARLNLAIALLQLNRIDDAARHFREVLRLDPANETAKRALAAIGR